MNSPKPKPKLTPAHHKPYGKAAAMRARERFKKEWEKATRFPLSQGPGGCQCYRGGKQ